ncbi:MAG: hypothetical protein AAF738_02340 [Bacteroidota bacterium]
MINNGMRVSTINHEDVKTWASTHNMRPTRIKRFKDESILDRIKMRFPEERYPTEEDLSWDTFFEIFDQEQLEFVMEDIADEAVENPNRYQFQPRKAY